MAAVLLLVGFVAIFSIGAPFLLTGAAMMVVGPFRHRRDVLWPALGAVWSFVIAYIVVAPLGCTGTSVAVVPNIGHAAQVGRTTWACTNVLGIDYSGNGMSYNPPLMPALLTGLVAGTAVGFALWRVLRLRVTAVRT
jgi:lysylphosphatidylglycerol synthetase-like protein (DUF2156 family)